MFKKLFGSSGQGQELQDGWNTLSTAEELEAIKEKSYQSPQLIFKHSTRCGISRMVWTSNRKSIEEIGENAGLYYLDLLANRAVSNEIAAQFGVVHQSPQVLVIRDGEVVAHASHGDISSMDFKIFLEKTL